MWYRRYLLMVSAALAVACLSSSPVSAQTVPSRIRIVYPFSAGGSGDTLARLVAKKMSVKFGNTVIVEDRTGAAGRIGTHDVKTSDPDGSTLLLTPIAPMSIYQHVYKSLSYDPIKDFAAVSQLATYDFGIAVAPSVKVKTLKELVAWVKANPDKANYAIPAAGSLPDFLGVMFSRAAGIKMVHVPYRGSAAAVADAIAGHVPIIITTVADLEPMYKAGRLRILATSGKTRSPFAPDVPTFKQAGYDLVASGWYAMFAPAKTPKPLIDGYSSVAAAAVHEPDVKAKLLTLGLTPTGTNAAELARIQKADSALWAPAVKASGFTARE